MLPMPPEAPPQAVWRLGAAAFWTVMTLTSEWAPPEQGLSVEKKELQQRQ